MSKVYRCDECKADVPRECLYAENLRYVPISRRGRSVQHHTGRDLCEACLPRDGAIVSIVQNTGSEPSS